MPGSTDNYSGYVFTKPSSDVIITHKDRVFVLGEKEKIEEYFKIEFDKRKNDEEIIGEHKGEIKEENIDYNDDEDDGDDDNKKFSPFYSKKKLIEWQVL